MGAPVVTDVDGLLATIRARGRKSRSVTAIAGPPGSGKSTLAECLVQRLNEKEPGRAAAVSQDGYHFDDAILTARGWRPRKGAPHTFDVAGFAHMLARLRVNAEPEIAVPVFDRAIEIARNAARMIPSSVRHLIVEGNYLLLQEAPWSDLAIHFDTTVFLDVPMPSLSQRLSARWQDLEPAARVWKLERNDIPNAIYCVEHSSPAEFILRDPSS